jgi:hypothetical protein
MDPEVRGNERVINKIVKGIEGNEIVEGGREPKVIEEEGRDGKR